MNALRRYEISAFDEQRQPITPTSVTVYTIDTTTEPTTIYLNDTKTAIGTTLSSPAGPTVAFWSDAASHDIVVTYDGLPFQLNDVIPGGTGIICDRTQSGVESRVDDAETDIDTLEELASGDIIVGNASHVATDMTMSGDATISNTGELTIGLLKVTTSKIANDAVDNDKLKWMLTGHVKMGGASYTPADVDLQDVMACAVTHEGAVVSHNGDVLVKNYLT